MLETDFLTDVLTKENTVSATALANRLKITETAKIATKKWPLGSVYASGLFKTYAYFQAADETVSGFAGSEFSTG